MPFLFVLPRTHKTALHCCMKGMHLAAKIETHLPPHHRYRNHSPWPACDLRTPHPGAQDITEAVVKTTLFDRILSTKAALQGCSNTMSKPLAVEGLASSSGGSRENVRRGLYSRNLVLGAALLGRLTHLPGHCKPSTNLTILENFENVARSLYEIWGVIHKATQCYNSYIPFHACMHVAIVRDAIIPFSEPHYFPRMRRPRSRLPTRLKPSSRKDSTL